MKKNQKLLYYLLFPFLITCLGASLSWGKGKPPQDDPEAITYNIEMFPAEDPNTMEEYLGVWGRALDIDHSNAGVAEANLHIDSVVNNSKDNWIIVSDIATYFPLHGVTCFGPFDDETQLEVIQLHHNTKRGNDDAIAEFFFRGKSRDGQDTTRYRLFMKGKFMEGYSSWPPGENEMAVMELTYWKTRIGGPSKNFPDFCVGEIASGDTSFKTIITITPVSEESP